MQRYRSGPGAEARFLDPPIIPYGEFSPVRLEAGRKSRRWPANAGSRRTKCGNYCTDSNAWFPFLIVISVALARSTLRRMTSADLVHTNGFEVALWFVR